MTLIEILIAISVFAVGVLSILQLVTNNIYASSQASKYMDATMLANQGLELIYEVRNTNSYKETKRDCYQQDIIEGQKARNTLSNGIENDGCKANKDFTYLANNKPLKISLNGPSNKKYRTITEEDKKDVKENLKNFRLYRHIGDNNLSYFNHTEKDGLETPYARYITFEKVEGYESVPILKVTSHILIDKPGKEPQEITMSSFIGHIIK